MPRRATFRYKFHDSVKSIITTSINIKPCPPSCRCTEEDGCTKIYSRKGCPPNCKNCKNQHFQPKENTKKVGDSKPTQEEKKKNDEDDYEMDLRVEECGTKGKGLLTKKLIKSGYAVIAYIGEVISKEEEEVRKTKYKAQGIIPNMFGSGIFTIDATEYGNDAKFANHSCEPNMIAVRYIVHGGPGNFKGILFIARREILPDEELTFNYGDFYSEEMACHCDSWNCAGTIGKEPKTLEYFEKELIAEIARREAAAQKPEVTMNHKPAKARVTRKRPATAVSSEVVVDKKRVCREALAGNIIESEALPKAQGSLSVTSNSSDPNSESSKATTSKAQVSKTTTSKATTSKATTSKARA